MITKKGYWNVFKEDNEEKLAMKKLLEDFTKNNCIWQIKQILELKKIIQKQVDKLYVK